MVDRKADPKRGWRGTLVLSGRDQADDLLPPPDFLAQSSFVPRNQTLLPAEVGILGHVLSVSYTSDLLCYSGIRLEEEDVRQLRRINSKYRSLLAPLTTAQSTDLAVSVIRKLRSDTASTSLLESNPLPEFTDGRSLIRIVQPVLPSPRGISNIFDYYRLHRSGKL